MANIFAILTAIALAAGAFLAYKNQEAYREEIANRESAQQKLARTQKRYEKAVSDRNATIAERKETEAEIESLREQEEAQQERNASLESEIKTKKATTEQQAVEIGKLEEDTAELGPVEDLARQIKRLKEQITGLEDERTMAEATQANLLAEQKGTESTIKRYNEENRKVSSKISYGSARITAIYGPWGFVTLSAGSNGGIVAGSKLDVVRGGDAVAQLQVRSVEPGRASADIIPDSLGEDVALMVGDKVVPASGK